MKHGKCSVLDGVLHGLVVIGALNWGLVGAFDFNLVTAIFKEGTTLTQAVYIIVGVAALWLVVKMLTGGNCCGSCKTEK